MSLTMSRITAGRFFPLPSWERADSGASPSRVRGLVARAALAMAAWPAATLAAIAIAAIAIAAAPAVAHDWYPVECCSGQDCRPRPCDLLEEQRDGSIRDVELGQTYSRDKVRPSQDGRCHVCTGAGAPDGRPICVFTVIGS